MTKNSWNYYTFSKDCILILIIIIIIEMPIGNFFSLDSNLLFVVTSKAYDFHPFESINQMQSQMTHSIPFEPMFMKVNTLLPWNVLQMDTRQVLPQPSPTLLVLAWVLTWKMYRFNSSSFCHNRLHYSAHWISVFSTSSYFGQWQYCKHWVIQSYQGYQIDGFGDC